MALPHATPQTQRPHIERRALLLLATLVVGLLVLAAMTAVFLWPAGENRRVDVGRADSFVPGTVTSFRLVDGHPYLVNDLTHLPRTRDPGFHVVRLDDGSLIALDWRSPHLGWTARWVPELEVGWLPGIEGQTGAYDDGFSYWLVDGTRVHGPAPRGLDRYAVEVTEGGRVIIDLALRTEGERIPSVRRGGPIPTATPASIPVGLPGG